MSGVSGTCRETTSDVAMSSSKREPHDASERLAPGRVRGFDERIEGRHRHVQGRRALGGLASDGAVADQPETLAGDLAAHQTIAWPRPGDHVGGRRIGAAQQQHGGRDHVFGDGDVVGAACREHRDAARLASRHVDVVEPDAETADRFQALRRIEKRPAHLRPVAHDEAPRLAQGGGEVVRPVDEVGRVKDVESLQSLADRRLVHEFRNDDIGHDASGQDKKTGGDDAQYH